MNCPSCGCKDVDKNKFCPECGENLEKIRAESILKCPECGTECKSGAKFCVECGFSFAAMREAAQKRKDEEAMLGFDLGAFAGFDLPGGSVSGGGFDLDALSWQADALGSAAIAEQNREAMNRALSIFEYLEQGNGTYIIVSLKNKSVLDVVIPVGVEAIGEGVFEGSNIFSVTLPEGLLQIGSRAFKNCKNLAKINMPNTLTLIGDEAFAGCEILDITLPRNLFRVGKNVILDTRTDK